MLLQLLQSGLPSSHFFLLRRQVLQPVLTRRIFFGGPLSPTGAASPRTLEAIMLWPIEWNGGMIEASDGGTENLGWWWSARSTRMMKEINYWSQKDNKSKCKWQENGWWVEIVRMCGSLRKRKTSDTYDKCERKVDSLNQRRDAGKRMRFPCSNGHAAYQMTPGSDEGSWWQTGPDCWALKGKSPIYEFIMIPTDVINENSTET